MSIQMSAGTTTIRRDRRATSYCDIWDIVAPEVPCPMCSGEYEERLAAGADDAASAFVAEHLAVVEDTAPDVTDEAGDVADLLDHGAPALGDVSAEASALLSLLAS